MPKQRETQKRGVIDTFKGIDFTAGSVDLYVKGVGTEYKTWQGAILSLGFLLIMLAVSLKHYLTMHAQSSITVYSYTGYGEGLEIAKEGYGEKENINIAYGVASFEDEEFDPEEYLNYGSVNIYYEWWNEEGDGDLELL